jgi:hypothetical protein|tara:strand:+ start:242 stop:673 length:432 start_codon:yes stop_codon:yes gene_type:complete
MFLSSDIWGPSYWFVLHTIALNYPEFPNAIAKKKHYDLIQNLPTFIPNKRMGKQFEKKLNEFPVTPYLSSRDSFMKWVHFMHNKINKKLGKPEINFFKGLELYYRNYEPKKTKKIRELKLNKKYVAIGTSILFIFLGLYFYNK